jgi:hypothetical protein
MLNYEIDPHMLAPFAPAGNGTRFVEWKSFGFGGWIPVFENARFWNSDSVSSRF